MKSTCIYLFQSYEDRGPVIDVVVWNDGDVWRAAVDTQGFEDGSENGKLADFVPLTNYRCVSCFGDLPRNINYLVLIFFWFNSERQYFDL